MFHDVQGLYGERSFVGIKLTHETDIGRIFHCSNGFTVREKWLEPSICAYLWKWWRLCGESQRDHAGGSIEIINHKTSGA